MKKSKIQLDIIPIYENEMFPTKEQLFHYKTELYENEEQTLLMMIERIKRDLWEYDCLIILKDGLVIKTLKKGE